MIKTLTAGSWKTTSTGITLIATGICVLVFAKAIDQAAIMGALGFILPGIGLIFARDNNKTSADVGIDTSPAAQFARDVAAQKPIVTK